MIDTPDLNLLVHRLRSAGYGVTVEQTLTAHALMRSLEAQGVAQRPDDLEQWLCPVFSSTLAEQTGFAGHFGRWLYPDQEQKEERSSSPMRSQKTDLPRRLVLVALIVVLALALGWGQGLLAPFLRPTPSAVPDATIAATPVDTSMPDPLSPGRRSLQAFLRHAVSQWPMERWGHVGLWFALCLLVGSLKVSTTERHSQEFDETLHPNKTPGPHQLPDPPLGAPSDIELSSSARAMRPTRRADERMSRRLAIKQTVSRTARDAGWPALVYYPHQRATEYLLLVDRVAYGDQLARYHVQRLRRLGNRGAPCSIYLFDRDLRTCLPLDPNRDPVRLEELSAQAQWQRLALYSDGSSLLHPLTGEVQAWTTVFERWPERVLITPKAVPDWGQDEKTLDRLLPVRDIISIESLADAFGPRLMPPASRDESRSSDTLLQYIQRIAEGSEPSRRQKRLLYLALRLYLGRDGFQWLCALAAFPSMSLETTSALGEELWVGKPQDGQKEALTNILHLPWFRTQHMPEWLRLALARRLSGEQRSQVRQGLVVVLNPAVDRASEHDLAKAREQAQRLVKHGPLAYQTWLRSLPEGSPYRDPALRACLVGRWLNMLWRHPKPSMAKRKLVLNPFAISIVSAAMLFAVISGSLSQSLADLGSVPTETRPPPSVTTTATTPPPSSAVSSVAPVTTTIPIPIVQPTTATPTATLTVTPSNTPQAPDTLTPTLTDTPLTPTPTLTLTDTPVPPTPTDTRVPPTAAAQKSFEIRGLDEEHWNCLSVLYTVGGESFRIVLADLVYEQTITLPVDIARVMLEGSADGECPWSDYYPYGFDPDNIMSVLYFDGVELSFIEMGSSSGKAPSPWPTGPS